MKRIIILFQSFFITVLLQAQPVAFSDMSVISGINNTGKNHGVAVGDFNGDGWEDIYVSRLEGPNLLYKNNEDGTFSEVAVAVGVGYEGSTSTSVWGDLDNDGDLDLYVGNKDEPNVLYLNNGNGSFTDITASAGVGNPTRPRSVLLADVDNDGFLDIYLANQSSQNTLYHNNGDLTFTDITLSSGAIDTKIAMGSVFFDYDNDRDLDLYLTHDANQAFILYNNDGNGNFTEVSEAAGVNYEGQGMGTDFGDFNRDGHLDLYITNLYENVLFVNNGNGTFTDVSASAGIEDPGMGWGISWMDCDNDGWQDIYVCNDYYFTPSVSLNKLYQNKGNGTFEDVSVGTPMQSPYEGYATACADFNKDGWLDIFVANEGQDGNQLFMNESSDNYHWISIRTIGTLSNANGIGARVELQLPNGVKLIDEVTAGSGYASQNSLNLHFGLGSPTSIDELIIYWPSGTEEVYSQIEVDQYIAIKEGEGLLNATPTLISTSPFDLTFRNPSVNNIDFNLQLYDAAPVKLSIYDIHGKELIILTNEWRGVGMHTISWERGSHIPGLYFVHLEIENKREVRKFMLL